MPFHDPVGKAFEVKNVTSVAFILRHIAKLGESKETHNCVNCVSELSILTTYLLVKTKASVQLLVRRSFVLSVPATTTT